MPAATSIPKLAALLVMVTAVALVSHEVSAVTANATEAHKSMSANAVLVSRDTGTDPKYDMHSLRTGDTTRAEAAEERALILENLRNTVSSWAKGVKMKFRPYSYEQLHSVSMDSAKDGLHPSPSVIKSDETDGIPLPRNQATDNLHLHPSDTTESSTELEVALASKAGMEDLAKKWLNEGQAHLDVHNLLIYQRTSIPSEELSDMFRKLYEKRAAAISAKFPEWEDKPEQYVVDQLENEFHTKGQITDMYLDHFKEFCGRSKEPSLHKRHWPRIKNQRDTMMLRIKKDPKVIESKKKLEDIEQRYQMMALRYYDALGKLDKEKKLSKT